jgi:hypothetical protein
MEYLRQGAEVPFPNLAEILVSPPYHQWVDQTRVEATLSPTCGDLENELWWLAFER